MPSHFLPSPPTDGDKPEAKKAKKEEAKPAAAAPTPATGGAGGDWTKKQGQDLVKLVEDEEERKKVGLGCCLGCSRE